MLENILCSQHNYLMLWVPKVMQQNSISDTYTVPNVGCGSKCCVIYILQYSIGHTLFKYVLNVVCSKCVLNVF